VCAWPPARRVRCASRQLAAPLAAITATLLYGIMIGPHYDGGAPARTAHDDGTRVVALVQGNGPNQFRWKRAFFGRTLATYAELTARTKAAQPDLIVWPENAVSFYVNRETLLSAQLGGVAAAAREGLLVGAPRRGSGPWAYNSAYLFAPSGEIRATY